MDKKFRTKSCVKNLIVPISISIVFIVSIVSLNYLLFERPQHTSHKDIFNDNPNRMYDVPEFEYLISKPECNRNSSAPYIVMLVNSSPTQFERRAACRDTWAHSDARALTYFLMGSVQSHSLQKKIDAEEAQYHDILQGNFLDSYHNLTYKHTMAMKWFSENCPEVKYMFKLDDDVFVNIPATYEYLVNNKNDKRFIMGINFPPRPTYREGKWKISFDDIREKFIPEYCSGQSAIYSYDFAKEAYKRTLRAKYLWIDDILIIGYIRMQLNIRIEPIYPYRLSDDALKMVLNGTNTTLPEPMFMVSEHDRKYDDVVKLWNLTEPYRRQHQLTLY